MFLKRFTNLSRYFDIEVIVFIAVTLLIYLISVEIDTFEMLVEF